MKAVTSSVAVVTAVLLLSACNHQPERRAPEKTEHFNTLIREDGSKTFEYTIAMQRPEGRRSMGGGTGGRGSKGGKGGRPDASQMEAMQSKMQARMERALESGLLARLETSGYCREGYFELDRLLARGRGTVRGECRESASTADRQLFPNPEATSTSRLQQFETFQR